MNKKFISIISLTFCVISFGKTSEKFQGFEVDTQTVDEEFKVALESGKKSSVRYYHGKLTRSFEASIEKVKTSITNFEDKCNNENANRREVTPKDRKCSYHNPSLVESIITRDFKTPVTKKKNEIDTFIVKRSIYNRSSFSHNDLIRVFEEKNEKGQRVIRITLQMLKEKEAEKYLANPNETDSAFLSTGGTFILTEVAPNKTELFYEYYSTTDHWILNKSISVGQVFDSMAGSIDLLFQSVKVESHKQMVAEREAKKKSTAN